MIQAPPQRDLKGKRPSSCTVGPPPPSTQMLDYHWQRPWAANTSAPISITPHRILQTRASKSIRPKSPNTSTTRFFSGGKSSEIESFGESRYRGVFFCMGTSPSTNVHVFSQGDKCVHVSIELLTCTFKSCATESTASTVWRVDNWITFRLPKQPPTCNWPPAANSVSPRHCLT